MASCVYFDNHIPRMSQLHPMDTDTQRLRDEALDWWVRRQDAGWRTEDETEFLAWWHQDPAHAQMYARCAQQSAQLQAMPADLLAGMRQRLAADHAAQARQNGRQQPTSRTRRRLLLWPAASAFATAAVGGVGYMAWQHLQAQPLSVQAFHTERGQQQNVTLDDGSKLRMDTATALEVRYYRQRREVHLREGQLMIEVQPDGRPFHVLAGTTRVTVVGTRFSVRYTPGLAGNANVQVAVEEGRVRVAPLLDAERDSGHYDLQAGSLLTAGQEVSTDASGMAGPIQPLAEQGIAQWRQQRVSFLDVPLSQALAELERYRATGLAVRDPEVAALRLSGTFDPMATAALHRALPRALPVQLQTRNQVTEVVLRK